MSRVVLSFCVGCLLGACSLPGAQRPQPDANSLAAAQPNILFVVFEDLSPRIGAYGDPVAHTPVLDALAAQSVLFENVFTTAGVCAPSRSSLITGVHQQALGTQHMRTRSPVAGMRGGGPIEYDAVPPPSVRAFPELLRAAGYYTSNNGKTDYQFGTPFLIWDDPAAEHPWRSRAPGQPFFAMVNIMTTHESYLWPEEGPEAGPLVALVRDRNRRELAGKVQRTDPAAVRVPPYLPDTPIVRADIARQYDNLSFAEAQLTTLLEQLEADGLAGETLVVVTTDHGDGLPRMKRSIYDSGIRVPLLVRYPDQADAGTRVERLVSFVDLAPSFLAYAGQPVPSFIQGQIAFGPEAAPARRYVYAAMDRHDEVPDRLRAVRDQRYKYIRNYRHELPFFRPLSFRDQLPTMQEVWRVAEGDGLDPALAALLTPNRPQEELYDLSRDPDEVMNLAANSAHRTTLLRLRRAYDDFAARVGDRSDVPEATMIEAMWPRLEQPATEPPSFEYSAGRVRLRSSTAGAAIGYRPAGSGSWQVYREPFLAKPGEHFELRAQRYGYRASETISQRVP